MSAEIAVWRRQSDGGGAGGEAGDDTGPGAAVCSCGGDGGGDGGGGGGEPAGAAGADTDAGAGAGVVSLGPPISALFDVQRIVASLERISRWTVPTRTSTRRRLSRALITSYDDPWQISSACSSRQRPSGA